jgi:hypothetical protein
MLSRTRESQMDKATKMMRDVVKYGQEMAQDKRLRTDLRAALDHGSKASDRLKKDIRAGNIYTRLAADKKLRRTRPCRECRRGHVLPLSAFHSWWLERFSAHECAAMARAIWGQDVTART